MKCASRAYIPRWTPLPNAQCRPPRGGVHVGAGASRGASLCGKVLHPTSKPSMQCSVTDVLSLKKWSTATTDVTRFRRLPLGRYEICVYEGSPECSDLCLADVWRGVRHTQLSKKAGMCVRMYDRVMAPGRPRTLLSADVNASYLHHIGETEPDAWAGLCNAVVLRVVAAAGWYVQRRTCGICRTRKRS